MVAVDIARVRGLYPTLAARTAQLDGSFAALTPESVVRAIIATLRSAPAQPGSRSTRSQQSATRVLRARRAAADLVGGEPDDVILGSSTVSLMLRFASLLSSDWQLGDELVLNRLDADVVARPWQRIARAAGAAVRWAEVDLETGELPTWQYDKLIGRHTRVVTVPLGNPATGTVPDVAAIAELAHAKGALVVVDAGAAPAHLTLDLDLLGADLVAVAAPSFGGPTVAALVARPGLFGEMQGGPDDIVAPDSFEIPPLPVELLDGFTAAVDHLAALDETATGTRRERLAASISASGRYTRELYERLDAGLRSLPGVTVLGAADRAVPTVAFTVDNTPPPEVGAFLHRRDVSVWTGPAGLGELLAAFGVDEVGGAVFAGVMPYTSRSEIAQLLEALRELTRPGSRR
ncbi:aminotransferase class V-fold PLP-dependent enzyme [Jatrophihabitans endophyticus]|uniref:aminotransferase class V-fold PLP-dependent enzyme n=1 Tax=Jatrophihabitans endophyticus TaxID=1206085 RepID=UPI0019EC0E92|nr:aminotransferase class V-fold PLP-dependent enzyme [Jatrophihabitans endophyticus]MBE7189634.1 aminotransferase class V-fold PLP-dependent enzyme [Jatrophihabitans endophyticus]